METKNELSGMDRRIERKRWTSNRIAWLAVAVIVIFLLVYGLISVGGSSTVRLESERLTISDVTQGAFQEFIPVSGIVTPLKTFYSTPLRADGSQQSILKKEAC